jgi:DNA invertase Pin-like site-specific DNA recombinase
LVSKPNVQPLPISSMVREESQSKNSLESGKRADRPQLQAAIAACNLYGAKLVIAKLDRLSRDAHLLLGLEKAGIDFTAADMPNANRLTVRIMAIVAEEEREMISKRTKEALAAAKARGQTLGGVRYRADGSRVVIAKETQQAGIIARRERVAARTAIIAPVIKELQKGGAESLRAIAAGLNAAGIPTASGRGQWSPAQVSRTLERL